MYIGLEMELNSSEADYQVVEVPGRDGDLIISNNRRKSFVQEIPVIYTGEYSERVKNIDVARQIMLTDDKFHNLTFNNEPSFVYQAAFLTAFKVGKNQSESTQTLQFEMMPYKYLVDGQKSVIVTSGATLKNVGTIVAKPLIKLAGSGDITLKIGSQSLTLKGVDTGIILDSDAQLATSLDGKRTQFDKMYGDFLTIPVGNQTISWTGSVTKVEITPRWAVRA